MTDNQGSRPATAKPGRRAALLGAGAIVFGLINIMTNGSEAPSQSVLILQYGALALGLLGLVGGLIMMATQR